MQRLLTLFLALGALALSPAPTSASARARHPGAAVDVTRCAYASQRAVARRHGLPTTADDAFSLQIYANPQWSQEADDAFDACVRGKKE